MAGSAAYEDDLLLQCRQDHYYVLSMVQNDGMALQFAGADLKDNKEIVLAAVNQNGLAIQFASLRTSVDLEIAEKAVKQNASALEFVPKEARGALLLKMAMLPGGNSGLDRFSRVRAIGLEVELQPGPSVCLPGLTSAKMLSPLKIRNEKAIFSTVYASPDTKTTSPLDGKFSRVIPKGDDIINLNASMLQGHHKQRPIKFQELTTKAIDIDGNDSTTAVDPQGLNPAQDTISEAKGLNLPSPISLQENATDEILFRLFADHKLGSEGYLIAHSLGVKVIDDFQDIDDTHVDEICKDLCLKPVQETRLRRLIDSVKKKLRKDLSATAQYQEQPVVITACKYGVKLFFAV